VRRASPVSASTSPATRPVIRCGAGIPRSSTSVPPKNVTSATTVHKPSARLFQPVLRQPAGRRRCQPSGAAAAGAGPAAAPVRLVGRETRRSASAVVVLPRQGCVQCHPAALSGHLSRACVAPAPLTVPHPAAAASARVLTIVDEKHCRHQVQRHVARSSAAPALAIMFDRASDRAGSLHSRGSSEPTPGGMRLMSGQDRGEVLCVGVVQRQRHECPVRLAVRGEPRPVPATEVAARAGKPSLCHVADDPAHSE